jgi:hypothetical protein
MMRRAVAGADSETICTEHECPLKEKTVPEMNHLKHGSFMRAWIAALLAYRFAYVLDRLANFAFGSSESLLDIPTGAVCCSLALHLFIIYRATDILFDCSLGLIEFALNFILIW